MIKLWLRLTQAAAGACLVVISGVACLPGGPTELTPIAPITGSPSPEAKTTVEPASAAIMTSVALAQLTPGAVPPRIAAPPGAGSPVARLSPVALPTPAPLATPVPPSQALAPAATALQTKVSALRTAMKGNDVATSLKVQRELLAAADTAETSLK